LVKIQEAISKKSFGPTRQRRTSLFVGPSFKLLGILAYACGLKLGSASILDQNPILRRLLADFCNGNLICVEYTFMKGIYFKFKEYPVRGGIIFTISLKVTAIIFEHRYCNGTDI
jgi:hypothetical protein